jgi:hypothetical protein
MSPAAIRTTESAAALGIATSGDGAVAGPLGEVGSPRHAAAASRMLRAMINRVRTGPPSSLPGVPSGQRIGDVVFGTLNSVSWVGGSEGGRKCA